MEGVKHFQKLTYIIINIKQRAEAKSTKNSGNTNNVGKKNMFNDQSDPYRKSVVKMRTNFIYIRS